MRRHIGVKYGYSDGSDEDKLAMIGNFVHAHRILIKFLNITGYKFFMIRSINIPRPTNFLESRCQFKLCVI